MNWWLDNLDKARPAYFGPRGGKYQDPELEIPWEEGEEGNGAVGEEEDTPQGTDRHEEITKGVSQIGEGLEDALQVKEPGFRQRTGNLIKEKFKSALDFAKYQGKTEARNNLNMFRYIGSVFSGGKIKMSPEERKAALAYMAHWTLGMVPAKFGGIAMMIKGVAAMAFPPTAAAIVGGIVAYAVGSRVIYPILSKAMKKVMESRHVGEKIDADAEKYVEGYDDLIPEAKKEGITFLKAMNTKGLDSMTPLLSRIMQEAFHELVEEIKKGDFLTEEERQQISDVLDGKHPEGLEEAAELGQEEETSKGFCVEVIRRGGFVVDVKL